MEESEFGVILDDVRMMSARSAGRNPGVKPIEENRRQLFAKTERLRRPYEPGTRRYEEFKERPGLEPRPGEPVIRVVSRLGVWDYPQVEPPLAIAIPYLDLSEELGQVQNELIFGSIGVGNDGDGEDDEDSAATLYRPGEPEDHLKFPTPDEFYEAQRQVHSEYDYVPLEGTDIWFPEDPLERTRVLALEEMRRVLARLLLLGWNGELPGAQERYLNSLRFEAMMVHPEFSTPRFRLSEEEKREVLGDPDEPSPFIKILIEKERQEEGHDEAWVVRQYEKNGCPGHQPPAPGEPRVRVLSRTGAWEYPEQEPPLVLGAARDTEEDLEALLEGRQREDSEFTYVAVPELELWLPEDPEERLQVVALEEMRRAIGRLIRAGWKPPTEEEIIEGRRRLNAGMLPDF